MSMKNILFRKTSAAVFSLIAAATLALECTVNGADIPGGDVTEDEQRQNVISTLEGLGQRGDINGDGIVNVMDMIRYKNSIVEGKDIETGDNRYCLDSNGDSRIDGKDAYAVKKDILGASKLWKYSSMPVMDGSTSAIPLEAGYKSKMLGVSYSDAKLLVKHHKTHESFSMLLSGENDMIFTVPISESQQKAADEAGVHLNLVPVAKEGFVFVVNRDNPVDSLTQQQIKDIYSGKITNWKEVGGNDEKIVPYQRNNDSGSQNYMVDFMSGSELMDPPKEYRLTSMAMLMDGLAVYDNAVNSIGYSVYSYAAQMYENSSDVKFIAVDGIKPTRESMADGTYPLLSSTYIMYTDKAPQKTLDFADWAVSDEGQACVLSCGYVPVKDMEYPDELKPYQAAGTGKEKPADYKPSEKISHFSDYIGKSSDKSDYRIDFLKDKDFQESVNRDIAAVCTETDHPTVETEIINGIMSVKIYKESGYVHSYSGAYATRNTNSFVRYLNYDLRNSVKIEKFSDLFCSGVDFVQDINKKLESEISMYYTSLLKTDFIGMLGNTDNFSIRSVCMSPDGPYMSETADVNYADDFRSMIYEKMIISEYFDNEKVLDDRYSSYDIYNREWETEQVMGTDGEIHTVVTGSRFHTQDEVDEHNRVYEKVWAQAKEISEQDEWTKNRRIIISEPHNGVNGDELNVLYVNFGKIDGMENSRFMFDTETGDRVYLSDIFGDQFEYGEYSTCYEIDIEGQSVNISFSGEQDEKYLDTDKVNMKYVITRKNDLVKIPLSENLSGVTERISDLYGYASSYVLEFGPKKTQWPIEGGWRVSARNKCRSHGDVWYECWDADDGDYYGWIPSRNIRFD